MAINKLKCVKHVHIYYPMAVLVVTEALELVNIGALNDFVFIEELKCNG